MVDANSVWPEIESSYAFYNSKVLQLVEKFNTGTFNKTAFLKATFQNPTNLVFQLVPVKYMVQKRSGKRRKKEEVEYKRLGRGCIIGVFTSSDIQKMVKIGLHVVLYGGDLFKENFKETAFKRFMIKLYDLQKSKNEDNDVLENFVKYLMNS